MTQHKNIKAYNDGYLMVNGTGENQVQAFKFLGNQYILADKKRNKKYTFDHKDWVSKRKLPFYDKAFKVLSRVYKKANDCKKSLKVGV